MFGRLLLGKYAIGESRGFLLHSGLMGQVIMANVNIVIILILANMNININNITNTPSSQLQWLASIVVINKIITEQSSGEGD